MKTLKQIGIMFAVALIVVSGANFFQAEDVSIGAITTILGTDKLSDSRTTINDNFTDLDTTKMEMATTSVDSITTLTNLVSIGTITSGVWNGTAIPVAYNGTGTTSPSTNYVMLGNGASGFKTVAGLGSSGQFLTSQGAGSPPQWTTSSVVLSDSYAWTGAHTWSGAASSTDFAVTNKFYAGGTATTTIDSAGNLVVAGTITLDDIDISDLLSTDFSAVSVTNSTTETTLYSVTVPGNTLGTGNFIRVRIPVTNFKLQSTGGSGTVTLRLKYGATTVATLASADNTNSYNNGRGEIVAELFANSSTSAQIGTIESSILDKSLTVGIPSLHDVALGTATEDSTGDLTLAVTFQFGETDANNTITVDNMYGEIIK